VLLLVLVAALPYALLLTARGIEFTFDDGRFIAENPAVHTPRPLSDYFTDPRTADPRKWSGIWRPLRTLDFMVDWQIAGHDPPTTWTVRWFHLRNLLYHAACALLLFALFRRFGLPPLPAWLGSSVFALHPVQVEAVAFITSRGDLMCGMFFLAALLVHSRCDRLSWRGTAATLLLACALLCKEAAVTFAPAAALLDWLFRDGRRLRTTLARWRLYLLYGLVTIAYVGAWLMIHHVHGGELPKSEHRWGGSLLGTLPMLGKSAVYYARLLLLPVDMAVDFYVDPLGGYDLLCALCLAALAVAIAMATVRLVRTGGPGALAVLWIALLLFPTSHIVMPVAIPTAERFLYLPMVGFALWAGLLLARMAKRGPAGVVLVVALLGCLFTVSADRALSWRSVSALWQVTLPRVKSPRAIRYTADTLLNEGAQLNIHGEREAGSRKLAAAVLLYDEGIRFWNRVAVPGHSITLGLRADRALALQALGRYRDAIAEADAVLAFRADHTVARYALALGLAGDGRLREATREIEIVVADDPTSEHRYEAARIHEKLAMQYNREGNRARAYASLARAWQFLPDPAANRGVRAALDAMDRDFERLVRPLEAAVAADPADVGARAQLGSARAAYGDYDRAETLFAPLLATPEARTPDVLFLYALYFWQWRDTPEGYRMAAEIYEEILRADPGAGQAAEQLAICRARLAGG
jgi:tetratricopeptide (TPR) repeat protein